MLAKQSRDKTAGQKYRGTLIIDKCLKRQLKMLVVYLFFALCRKLFADELGNDLLVWDDSSLMCYPSHSCERGRQQQRD